MSPRPSAESAEIKLIICDSNVVIMMAIFRPTVMFAATYSFGEIEVHRSVIEELERWLERKGAKFRKFGQGIIEDALHYSKEHTGRLKELSDEQRRKSHKVLSAMESSVSLENKGADTSSTDKDLLTLAWKNKAKLATQERTMRAVALRSLGKDALLSFEEMVADLHAAGSLSKKDIVDGVDNLDRFGESLRSDGKAIIDSILRRDD